MKLSLCGYAAASLFILAGAALADGQAVYTANCAGCHAMMSPKTGDKAAWAPLIKQGTDTLVASVVKGKGMMPAKGGHASLSNADIKSAVEYMESQSK
jgi:cytochrome c5